MYENFSKAVKNGRYIGLGLRSQHVAEILAQQSPIPWFEVLTDNYLLAGGRFKAEIDAIVDRYPIALHSVGLSLGSTDPLDFSYLSKIKNCAADWHPLWISDHVAWTSLHGYHFHDLLPLPYTEESVSHVAMRIMQVQEFLGERILIENISTYLNFEGATMTEWEFVAQLVKEADCYLLLDLNNVYINSVNHGFSARQYLKGIPLDRVRQLHLAGFEEREGYLLDSHSRPVANPVWELFEELIKLTGPLPGIIEWDNDIPALARMIEEMEIAERRLAYLNTGKIEQHGLAS